MSCVLQERYENDAGPFTADTIEFVIEKVASALDYLHTEKQIMHGDLKSGNVLIVGDFDNVKLCDFGVTLPLNSEGRVSDPDRKYVGTEAWAPLEAVRDAEITDRADIFAFGLLVYEMLSLHSPHVDKLAVDDDSENEDGDSDGEIDEEAFRQALGTRPPLPDSFQFDPSYRAVLEIFFAATNEEAAQRPSARDILDMLASKASDEDSDEHEDSVLCVNMVKGETAAVPCVTLDTTNEDSILESNDSSSIVCIDDSISDCQTPSAS